MFGSELNAPTLQPSIAEHASWHDGESLTGPGFVIAVHTGFELRSRFLDPKSDRNAALTFVPDEEVSGVLLSAAAAPEEAETGDEISEASTGAAAATPRWNEVLR
eukprot:g1512.t1